MKHCLLTTHNLPTVNGRFACWLWIHAVILIVVSISDGLSQARAVTGRVTGPEREGLPGVSIAIKGTQRGATTDLNGDYTIELDSVRDAVLIFSFVGFETVEETVGQRSLINVQMTLSSRMLQEIVVTGYSTIRKTDVSSSISVVDVDEMKKVASPNFADQLQGKVAGVQISTSGDPASYQYVRVRGIGTINNNEPLYVIDGVPVQNETDMKFLNPNDIETMQVLKDAAAGSIYGARAVNGVIVITTKRGTGRSRFNVDFFTGIHNPRSFPEMASPDELLQIQLGLSAGANALFNSEFYVQQPDSSWTLPDFMVHTKGYAEGDPAVDPSNYVLNTVDLELFGDNYPIAEANKEGTNWFEELYKPASMTSLQVSASGGNDKGSHYLSLNYYDYNGILIENRWQRVQTRLNSTFSAGKNFRFGENLNIAFQTGKGFDGPRFNVESAYSYLSIVRVFDIDGYWASANHSGAPSQNPVAAQTRSADGSDSHNFRVTGNVFIEADFLKHFSLRVNAGLDYFQQPYEFYAYPCPECGMEGSNKLTKGLLSSRNWILSGTLKYDRSVGAHNVQALLGAEARQAYTEGFWAEGSNLPYGDDPYQRELTNAASGTASNFSSTTYSRMVSGFFNANYVFRDRYIMALTLRSDGTSKFITDRYGFFPGISLAWRISEEPFLGRPEFLDNLKLRGSYGVTGNNEVTGGDFPGHTLYGISLAGSSYAIQGRPDYVTRGYGRVTTGNPDLKWESSYITNLGIDATLMNSLDLTVEWYSRQTKDMIVGIRPPLETGLPNPVNQNIGSMLNRGLELQAGYRGKAMSSRLAYTVGLTGTFLENKVLALDSLSIIWGNSLHPGNPPITATQAGHPVSQFYGYVAEGLWQSQSQIDSILWDDPGAAKPGRMRFRDIDGNGMIDEYDRTFIGSPVPKFILGLNLTATYRSFDFTVYISGVFGQEVFNAVKSYTDFNTTDVMLSGPWNRSKSMLYEAGSRLPVLDLSDNYSGKVSSYFVEDGSFIRCRNMMLGYTLPKANGTQSFRHARVYFQVQNLFTLTRYTGLDPDVTVYNMAAGNQPGRDLTTGLDAGRYPWSRQFVVGFNFEF
jgi:TonB-linked SusC/RagA family outer membrane protein